MFIGVSKKIQLSKSEDLIGIIKQFTNWAALHPRVEAFHSKRLCNRGFYSKKGGSRGLLVKGKKGLFLGQGIIFLVGREGKAFIMHISYFSFGGEE